MATKIATGTWSDIKAKLAEFDRADLLKVVQDLYAASKENQAFLHARFCLGDDVLRPYKMPLARWLWPDMIKNQDISVAKAKKLSRTTRRPSDSTSPKWVILVAL